MKKKKKFAGSDDPVIIGYWDGRRGTAFRSDDEEYMHGWYNGAVDAMRDRGELTHVIPKPL